MEALRTDYPPSPFRQPFLLSTLWSHPCAKNYQYLLNVSHKAWPCTGRSCRGLTGEGIRHWRGINEMPRAISLRVSKDSRCSGTRNPRGPPSSEFHQRSGGEPNPDLLQREELGDGRGKSSLLWIVIIGLLTTPRLPPITKSVRARVWFVLDENNLFIPRIFIIYPPLLSCQSVAWESKSLFFFNHL